MALIEARELSRVYSLDAGRVVALDRIDLDIEAGEMTAIMGPSGSGKSTLMNLIGCLDRATGGTYRLDGVAVETLDANGLARLRNEKIGFVFQQFNLLARADAAANAELPMLYAGVDGRRAGRGPWRRWSGWASATARITGRCSSPAASSSASPSRGPW